MDEPLTTRSLDEPHRPAAVVFEPVPIERVDVFQSVLKRLEGWLREADLNPGDRLPPERELARLLQVSRGSVRQALKVLISGNRLEQRHGSGTYVKSRVNDVVTMELLGDREMTVEFLMEVAQVRASVDTAALRGAAANITQDDLDRLREFFEERESELAQEPAAPGSLDLRFEAELGRISGNQLLQRLQAAIHDLYLHAWAAQGVAPAAVFKLHEEHLEILDAMQAGDFDLAADLMTAHVSRAPQPDVSPPVRGASEEHRER